jgi:hypothetical protein
MHRIVAGLLAVAGIIVVALGIFVARVGTVCFATVAARIIAIVTLFVSN